MFDGTSDTPSTHPSVAPRGSGGRHERRGTYPATTVYGYSDLTGEEGFRRPVPRRDVDGAREVQVLPGSSCPTSKSLTHHPSTPTPLNEETQDETPGHKLNVELSLDPLSVSTPDPVSGAPTSCGPLSNEAPGGPRRTPPPPTSPTPVPVESCRARRDHPFGESPQP